MWSNFTVALIFAIGFSAWLYSKIYRSTGGNNASSLTVAGIAGGIVLLFVWLVLSTFFKVN